MLAELGARASSRSRIRRAAIRCGSCRRILNGRGIYDYLLNRGKQSGGARTCSDPERRPVAAGRLSTRADVVVESFRPADRAGGSVCPASNCARAIRG